MLEELDSSFQDLLTQAHRISFDVRRTAFELEGTPVLSEEHLDDSLPFAFYRDGVRRIAFTQGLTREELIGVVEATAQRLSYAGLGEDIVSLLWRLDLEHVDYVVVDTAFTTRDPNSTDSLSGTTPSAADHHVAGVLNALFGGDGTDAPMSVHLDGRDIDAKFIADALGRADDMSPGLQPTSGLRVDANYAREVLSEVAEEGEDAIAIRGVEGALRAFAEPLPDSEIEALSDAVLRMLDTAILENQFSVAARIVDGMRKVPQPRERVTNWMEQVVAEARIRHVGARYAARISDEERAQVVTFFRACSGWAVDPLLQLIPSISDARSRRNLSDLVLEFGIYDLDLLRPLLRSEQAFVAQEAVYMLSRLPQEGSIALLRELRQHPLPQLRAAVAEFADKLPRDAAAELVADLLDDVDPRVRSTAAKTLAKHPSKTTELMLESAAQRSRLEGTSLDVKRSILEAYAQVAQERAVQPVARYVRDGESLFALREQEELAIAGVWALARIRSVTAVEILKRACMSRHRRVKHAAREALVWMKENI